MDALFGWLSRGLSGSIATAVGAAFLWGIASLAFDPSHLTAIPLPVAFINGDASGSRSRATVLSVLFGAGAFSAIAVAGFISAVAGRLVGGIGPWAMYLVAGVLSHRSVAARPGGSQTRPEVSSRGGEQCR